MAYPPPWAEEARMKVESILAQKGTEVITTGPDVGLADAAKLLSNRRIGAVIVTDPPGQVVGIISERDIVRTLAARREDCIGLKVADAMTRNVITCAPEDSIAGLMALMTERRFRHAPVKDGDRLVGIVTLGDMVKCRVDEVEREAASMREYITIR